MADFSVVAIIPLYNGERWIEETIRSVFAQTLQPDQFIVVDDGSTDEGPAIVERLGVRLLRKPNGGQSSARNFGVAHSKSALIALLDHDDLWYPTHLERLIEPFRQSQSLPLGWVYSDIDEISESGAPGPHRLLHTFPARHPKRSIEECVRRDMLILPSASLIDRKAFEAVGGFDRALCGYEDDDLFLRIYAAGYDNIFIDEALSQWRRYPTSTSYSQHMERSRAIYAAKLFQQYPEHARSYLRPRFQPHIIASKMRWISRLQDRINRIRYRLRIRTRIKQALARLAH